MRRLHLGCGFHKLPPPWENYDRDVDLRQRLPFADGEAAFIFSEHVIEHLPFSDGLAFLSECHRVLAVGGVLRLSFPDVTKLEMPEASLYMDYLRRQNRRDITTLEEAWLSMATDWGHLSVWTVDMALRLLAGLRFSAVASVYGESHHPELLGVDGRHLWEGLELARAETGIVEATKQG